MRIFSRLITITALIHLIFGVAMVATDGNTERFDKGISLIVTAFMLLFVMMFIYHQTTAGTGRFKTLNRNEMYLTSNLALVSLTIGDILYRQIEFNRSGLSEWSVNVGVPTFDGIFGYLIFVVPFNLLVYALLKNYASGRVINTARLRPRGGKWRFTALYIFHWLLVGLSTLGVLAAINANDYTFIPSMMMFWIFTLMLLIGQKLTPQTENITTN